MQVFYDFTYDKKDFVKKPVLGKDPTTRVIDSMLLVDEANSIMKYNFDVLESILLQGREFGVGVLF